MRKINLERNIQLCFESGFGSLITAKVDEDYRNAVISIHNGLELLMKLYLRKKDPLLVYRKITPQKLLKHRNDLRKEVKMKGSHTLSFRECIDILDYFSELPERNRTYLTQLDYIRNGCVHSEYSYDEKELRKLLIVHIYQFICDLISEKGRESKEFIPEKYITPLNKYKDTIDDEIRQGYYSMIESAKRHYLIGLNRVDRLQKADTEDYTKRRFDIIVECPACEQNALLRRRAMHSFGSSNIIKRDLILRDLSCHYCGLSITDYDQLKLQFKDKERPLPALIHRDYSTDCPDSYDCPDYYDCRDDCPEGYDCGNDCPEGYDCRDDCPEGYDCGNDCPEGYDCRDDCPDDC